MTTTEAELDALMRLMESMEDSLRNIQDDWRSMRDGLEEYLLAESDGPSAASSAATTPERPGQQENPQSSPLQQSDQHGDGQMTLAVRGRKRRREFFDDNGDDGGDA